MGCLLLTEDRGVFDQGDKKEAAGVCSGGCELWSLTGSFVLSYIRKITDMPWCCIASIPCGDATATSKGNHAGHDLHPNNRPPEASACVSRLVLVGDSELSVRVVSPLLRTSRDSPAHGPRFSRGNRPHSGSTIL